MTAGFTAALQLAAQQARLFHCGVKRILSVWLFEGC